MLRIIVSETFSLVYLMWGFKLKKKKRVLGHTLCAECVNECMEKERSGCDPRPNINYFPPLCSVSETQCPVY